MLWSLPFASHAPDGRTTARRRLGPQTADSIHATDRTEGGRETHTQDAMLARDADWPSVAMASIHRRFQFGHGKQLHAAERFERKFTSPTFSSTVQPAARALLGI